MQHLEHFIKTHRVATAWRANRERPLEPGDEWRFEQRFAGAHPVAVALHGVDLAVVRDVAIRVRERPRRKRVGAKAAVHEHQGRLHVFIRQIGEEHAQLGGGEHSFIYECARRQRRKVGVQFCGQFVFDAFARHKQQAVELDTCCPVFGRHQQLGERRHHPARARAEARRLNRHFTPTECDEPFFVEHLGNCRFGLCSIRCISRQKRQPHSVGTSRWQRNTGNFAQKLVGHLQQNARAIPCFGFGTSGPAVFHAAQGTEPGLHDAMAGHTFHMHHKRHAARVVLEAWVV